jgi:hypothetical protein
MSEVVSRQPRRYDRVQSIDDGLESINDRVARHMVIIV